MWPPPETASGLAAVLRGGVADIRLASKAGIVSIFLYEGARRTYSAPLAPGRPHKNPIDREGVTH